MTRVQVNLISLLQEPAEGVQFAPAQGAPAAGTTADGQNPVTTGAAPQAGSPWTFWVMMLLLFGFMWFFVIRPESKRRKAQQSFHSSLQKGEDVVTAGGMHGTIASIDGDSITLKVNGEVRLKFDRNAIARYASTPAGAPAPAAKK
jgi:preprotein translocase subunit YajC